MKKILFTTLLMLLCTHVDATMVIIDYQGDTIVRPQTVERNLLINSDDGGAYNIAVRPLEESLKSSDGSVEIPLTNLYINNTKEDVYLRYNQFSNVFDVLEMGGSVARNLTAKIRDFGMVPAGEYIMPLEIQAIDADSRELVATSVFNLQFIIPTVQQISLYKEVPKITVDADNAFDVSKKVANEVSPTVYINSNCDWELSVNTDDFGDMVGNYYIRTVSASSNINERLQERVLLQPNKEVVIAKGKAPANNEYVVVEYSLESKDGKYLSSGTYENRVRYILREIN